MPVRSRSNAALQISSSARVRAVGLIGLVLLAAGWLVPAKAGAADGLAGRSDALISQLGDDRYPVRRRAAAELEQLGMAARDALLQGLGHEDVEVRRSCRRLLRDILDQDYRQRVTAFVADTEGLLEHSLPGWKRYSDLVGDAPAARALFAQMLQQEPGLFSTLESDPNSVDAAIETRLNQVYAEMYTRSRQRKHPDWPSVAAIMFVSSDPEQKLSYQTADHAYWSALLNSRSVRQMLGDPASENLARAILGQWIAQPCGLRLVQRKLLISTQYSIPQGLSLAVESLRRRQIVSPGYRQFAIHAVGVIGGKDQLAQLQKVLDDDGVCGRRVMVRGGDRTTINVEVRDVALAWLVHLTDQDHADYGQPEAAAAFERLKRLPTYTMTTSAFGFPNDQARNEAINAWNKWVEDHPLPMAPPLVDPPQPHILLPGNAPVAAVPNAPPVVDTAQQPEIADRQLTLALGRSRRLVREGREAEAAFLLGDILVSTKDYAYVPDRSVPLSVGIRTDAETLLHAMPPSGRQAYELRFGTDARKLLDDAIAARDTAGLLDISRRFFFTRAGMEATYLIATHFLDQDEPYRAALFLDRVAQQSWYAGELEPDLSIKLATSWLLAAQPSRAQQVLERLKLRRPTARARIAGRQQSLFANGSVPKLLATLVPNPPDPAASGWLMYRGRANGNATVRQVLPFLGGNPVTSVTDDEPSQRQLQNLHDQQHEKLEVRLPSIHPIVVADHIVVRTATHLRAMDRSSGELRWQTELDDPLAHLVRDASRQPDLRPLVQQGFEERLWEDFRFGTLSSDGQRVYGVEQLGLQADDSRQRMEVMPNGKRYLARGTNQDYNLLTAFDLATGKLKWEIGGPTASDPALPMAGTYFLGPPLPLGGRLYVVAREAKATQLVKLDPQNGAPLWRLTLRVREPVSDPRMVLKLSGLLDEPDKHCGSPASADGVLVCALSPQDFVAVDIAARSLRWAYCTAPPVESPKNQAAVLLAQRQLTNMTPNSPPRDWADASVTIHNGRVLLTPRGSNELYCLNLHNGQLQWTAPRQDGLYVGGVQQGVAVVVGRTQLTGVDVNTGQPAWQAPFGYPVGTVPSGRGFMAERDYSLPLSNGEVVALDCSSGKVRSRSRSSTGVSAGNLVPSGDTLVSQNLLGTWRFFALHIVRQRLEKRIAAEPESAASLATLGEVLFDQGHVEQSVAKLERSLEIEPTEGTRHLLSLALLAGLRRGMDGYAEKLERLEFSNCPEFLEQLANSYEVSGDRLKAFQTYVELSQLLSADGDLRTWSVGHKADARRWLRAQLDHLWHSASDNEQHEMAGLLEHGSDDDQAAWLDSYLSSGPIVRAARLKLAVAARENEQWLRSERLLRQVARRAQGSTRNRAVAELAQLYRSLERPDLAAPVFGYLNDALGNEAGAEGKTGRELFAELPADDPVRRQLAAPLSWPTRCREPTVIKRSTSGSTFNATTRHVLPVETDGSQLDTRLFVEMQYDGKRLFVKDKWGRDLFEVTLDTSTRLRFVGDPSQQISARLSGHLLAARVGDQLFVFDLLDKQPKLLWSRRLVNTNNRTGVVMIVGNGFRQAHKLSRLVVNSHAVCFQVGDAIVAADPLTGQTLWTQSGVGQDSALCGNDRHLYVIEPTSGHVRVFNSVDGRQERSVDLPFAAELLVAQGSLVLLWSRETNRGRLSLFRFNEGRNVWQRDYSPDARLGVVEDEVGVLEPSGRLEVLRVVDGKQVVEAKMEPLAQLDSISLTRSRDRYLVLANTIGQAPSRRISGMVAGHGRLASLDRATGKLLWTQPLEQQTLRFQQPSELPLLVMTREERKQVDNRTRLSHAVTIVDVRDGRIVHTASGEGGSILCNLRANAELNGIDYLSRRASMHFRFTQ